MSQRSYRKLVSACLVGLLISGCGNDNSSSSNISSPNNDNWPTALLSTSAAVKVDENQFLSTNIMRDWHKELDAYGLRTPGSTSHEAYIQDLYSRLKKAGVQDVHFEDTVIKTWEPTSWSLGISSGINEYQKVTASYIPYSGSTPNTGIASELEYLTPNQLQSLLTGSTNFTSLAADYAGKIVLVDFPVPALTAGFYGNRALSIYDPENNLKLTDPYKRTNNGTGSVINLLKGFKSIGAKGIVFIANDAGSKELAQIYAPYYADVYGLPGFYVDKAIGVKLRNEAASNHSIQLTLTSTEKNVTTKNIVGTIAGKSDELVVLNSHTDGTNGVEDNGPNAVIDIAQYLTRLPKKSLDRSIMIMLSTGHFYAGSGIRTFLDQHKNDGVVDRINAVITIEHLGINEWIPNENGILETTGKKEIGALFTSNQSALVELAKQWPVNAKAGVTFVMPPLKPNGTYAEDAVWPGEGHYFWGAGGIPTINYLTGPAYLLNYGVNTVDFVDFELLKRETVAFTQMAIDLTHVPRSELPRRMPPSTQ
ncbi:M28 family peptidase [Acinetobacter sp. 1124_18A]|uniref:M28 family peptidase n=1 Tax=Acinetobacter sp. 1124_18A TaxID=2605958 RepID=UPI00405908F9